MTLAADAADAATPAPARWLAGVEIGLLALAALVTFAILWRGGVWITNDGPQHLFASYAVLHIDDPALAYARWYTANTPASARGFHVPFQLLEPLLGWQLAYRWVLVLAAELWALAFVALVVSFHPRRRLIGLLGFPTAFQLVFYLGFTPFLVGIGLGMLALATWRLVQRPGLRTVLTTMLMYLAARAHSVAAVVAGLLLAVHVLLEERERLSVRLGLITVVGLPAAVVFLQTVVQSVDVVQTAQEELTWWLPFGDRALRQLACGPAWRGLGVWAFMALGCLGAARGGRLTRGLALAGVLGAIISVSLPRDVLHWQFAGIRLLPLSSMLVIALIDVENLSRRAAAVLRLGLLLYVAASFMWASGTADTARQRSDAMLAAMTQMTPTPRVLATYTVDGCLGICEPDIPGFLPGFNVGSMLGIVLGGAPRQAQANLRSIHLILAKPMDLLPMPRPEYAIVDPARRAGRVRNLTMWLSTQEAVAVIGDPEALQAFRDAGWVAEVDAPPVLVGHFEGCSGRVHVRGGAGKTANVGGWPSKTAAAHPTLDDTGQATVSGVPCGEVWLYVDGVQCVGGGTELPLLGRWTRGADNVLDCTPALTAPTAPTAPTASPPATR